jgi:hypothetical protein
MIYILCSWPLSGDQVYGTLFSVDDSCTGLLLPAQNQVKYRPEVVYSLLGTCGAGFLVS